MKEKSINQMANSRQEKITRYKEQKEQERQLKVSQESCNRAQSQLIFLNVHFVGILMLPFSHHTFGFHYLLEVLQY